MTLPQFNREYEQIMHDTTLATVDHDRALVPLVHDPGREIRNRPLIAFYRTVSESRVNI